MHAYVRRKQLHVNIYKYMRKQSTGYERLQQTNEHTSL